MLQESITIDKWSIGNNIEYMDLEIFKGFNFHNSKKLDIKLHQKKEKKIFLCRITVVIQNIQSTTMLLRSLKDMSGQIRMKLIF